MNRKVIFIYGVVSYLVGMAGLLWFILFVGRWEGLPFHIDSRLPGTQSSAILINLGLIVVFGLQHSVMARPAFKQRWKKIIPAAAERSTYVLISGILMCAICLYWQPINGYLWQVDNPIGQTVLITIFWMGWFITVLSTFLINHFELFGLQQIYFNLINKTEPSPSFTDRFLYKLVRHPLQLGILMGLWFTPAMSMSHLMLSVLMSGYIFIGLYYEERDLVNTLGGKYQDYQNRVRMIVPLPKKQRDRSH